MKNLTLLTLFLALLLALACAGQSPAVSPAATPMRQPDLEATVQAAVSAALPTETPTPMPDISATVAAGIEATQAAAPTPTPTPPPTPNVEATVEARMAATIAAMPTPTPTPDATLVAYLQSIMRQPTATPTPTVTLTPTAMSTATPEPTPMPEPTATPRLTATATPRPTPTPVPSVASLRDIDPVLVQDLVFHFLNKAREDAGVALLVRDVRLDVMSYDYSIVMAEAGTARHGLTGKSQLDRASDAGFHCSGSRSVGENLAKRPVVKLWRGNSIRWWPVEYDEGSEGVAKGLMQQWMGSDKGHQNTILDPIYRRVGIAIVVVDEYWANIDMEQPVVYAATNFAVCK